MENSSEFRQEIVLENKIQRINDTEKLSYEKKLKSVKLSNNVQEMKSQLESEFNLFLEGILLVFWV